MSPYDSHRLKKDKMPQDEELLVSLGVFNLCMWPRMAMTVAQHRIGNLLKTL